MSAPDEVSQEERSDDDILVLLWGGENWAGFGKPGDVLKLPNYLGHEVHKSCPIPCRYTTDR